MSTKIRAIEQYQRALACAPSSSRKLLGAVAGTAGAAIEYVYQYNQSDREYALDEYPVSGQFNQVTAPWFDSLDSVPADWQWTTADTTSNAARGDQVTVENTFIQANVPGQTYSGTVVEQIQQRYTKGMWSTNVFHGSYIQTLTDFWIESDAEFGRQRLGGPNPDVVARYAGSAAELAAWLSGAAGAADKAALQSQLEAARGEGRLFACDYRPVLQNVLDGQLVRNGQTLAAPLVLLEVSGAALLPVAIQLDPAGNGYVFSPADDANSWLLAKLWAANADAQWWFSGTHLFNAHSVTMLFATAALNQIAQGSLASDQPILILLYPHLQKVFNINNAVYNVGATSENEYGIYQKGSFCDQFLPTGRIGLYQIIHNLYQSFRFDDAAFDRQLANRGIDSKSLLVSFPYRDDGQVWWDAIQTFVGEIVDASYGSDAAVASDAALSGWMKLAETAFNQDGTTRFTWTPTRAYLKQVATNLFFTGSVQHTAVNNSMMPGWGFLPNGPFAMTGPVPTGPGVTDAAVLAALPDPQTVTDDGAVAWPIQSQINFVMNGTSAVDYVAAGSNDGASLAEIYPYATGSAQATAVQNFHAALWNGSNAVASRIKAQQAQRITAFHEANPETTSVPNSVSYYYLTVDNSEAVELGVNSAVMNCIQI